MMDGLVFTAENTVCFSFGGVLSSDYGVKITGIQVDGTPERDVSYFSVAGRSGDLIVDNHRWKDMEITYSCAIASEFLDRFQKFKNELLAKTGYQELTDSIHPDFFRLASIVQPIQPETLRRSKSGVFDLAFRCKPQRFLFSGLLKNTISKEDLDAEPGGYTLYNQYFHTALPVITVYGLGSGTLAVGDVVVDILSLEDRLTLDCEMMNAYRQVGNGAMENKNSAIRAAQFPVLRAGENRIRFSGGIEKVDIIPRWWIL